MALSIQEQNLVDQIAAAQKGQSAPSSAQDVNLLAVLFTVLLQSINVNQDTATTVSKQLNLNANLQNSLNNQAQGIAFTVLPNNASTNEINAVNQINENKQFERQNIQANVVTLRQQGSIEMTGAQVVVDYMQQNGSEITAVLQIQITILQLINKMSPFANN